jgi:hypothetical protein
MLDEQKEWAQKFGEIMKQTPAEGTILRPLESDANAILVVELHEGSPPFVFGRAYVPEIVGEELGWFLHSSKSQGFHGWKCILMPRARTELFQRHGLESEIIEVKSLKVVRQSNSKKSLLCEVHEYVEVEKDETGE